VKDKQDDIPAGQLLTEAQAAKMLNFSVRALQAWRYYEKGPEYVRVSGRGVRYTRQALIDWIIKNTVKPSGPH
jgi:hypothetical protein